MGSERIFLKCCCARAQRPYNWNRSSLRPLGLPLVFVYGMHQHISLWTARGYRIGLYRTIWTCYYWGGGNRRSHLWHEFPEQINRILDLGSCFECFMSLQGQQHGKQKNIKSPLPSPQPVLSLSLHWGDLFKHWVYLWSRIGPWSWGLWRFRRQKPEAVDLDRDLSFHH